MSFLDKFKNKAEELKNAANDIVKKQYVTEEEKQKRVDICHSCPHYQKMIDGCRRCGCIVSIKTHLEHSECPVGKW